MKQQSLLPQGCTGRCQRIPGAFRKSALVPSILVCRFFRLLLAGSQTVVLLAEI